MKKVTERSLTKLADAAFEQTAKQVINRAKETGAPVIVWQAGEVKRVGGAQRFSNYTNQWEYEVTFHQ